MPIYEFGCSNGHRVEEFFHTYAAMEATPSWCCESCGGVMARKMPLACPLTYFETGRTLVTPHITGKPVEITSFRQHEKLMKENHRAPAYYWTQVKSGDKQLG